MLIDCYKVVPDTVSVSVDVFPAGLVSVAVFAFPVDRALRCPAS
jgi:hypothetical protein